MADDVNVMYAGTFVETGSASPVFSHPRHPYTLGLLQSVPRLDTRRVRSLQPIAGQPRNMLSPPSSCPFASRCRSRTERCTTEVPVLEAMGDDHRAACFNPPAADEWQRARLGASA